MKKIYIALTALLLIGSLTHLSASKSLFTLNQKYKNSINSSKLEKAMAAYGYTPQKNFKAYIIKLEPGLSPISKLRSATRYSMGETATEVTSWFPASTVKLYATVAASIKAQENAVLPSEKLVFNMGGNSYERTFSNLVTTSLTESDNIAYNFLVQFSGYEWLHEEFFPELNGFESSALCKAYYRKMWVYQMKGPTYFADMIPVYVKRTPKYVIRKNQTHSELELGCKTSCQTSLFELGECMRRLIFQDELAEEESYHLDESYRSIILASLSKKKSMYNNAITIIKEEIGQDLVIYNKPGYGAKWYSEIIYFQDPNHNKHWILAIADYSSIDCMDTEIRILSKIIKNNKL